MIVSTTNSEPSHKDIVRDYPQELRAIWREKLASIDSGVLCETCGVQEWLKKIE